MFGRDNFPCSSLSSRSTCGVSRYGGLFSIRRIHVIWRSIQHRSQLCNLLAFTKLSLQNIGYSMRYFTLIQSLPPLSFQPAQLHKVANTFKSSTFGFPASKQHGISEKNIPAGRIIANKHYMHIMAEKMAQKKCNTRRSKIKQAIVTPLKYSEGKDLSQKPIVMHIMAEKMPLKKCSTCRSKIKQATDTPLKHSEGKDSSQKPIVMHIMAEKMPLKKVSTRRSKLTQATVTPLKHSEGNDLSQKATVMVFDLETTGLSCTNNRIIEFAAQDLVGGRHSTFQSLVNPECFVPNENIHGISNQMVNRSGVPRWKDLAPILVQYVKSRQKAGGPVIWVAHNGRRFDARFLVKEFNRCSLEIPSDWVFVDTLPLARKVMKLNGSTRGNTSLSSLREHYRIPLIGSAHRAMSDVNTLALVLQKLSFELKLPVSGLLELSFKASDLFEN